MIEIILSLVLNLNLYNGSIIKNDSGFNNEYNTSLMANEDLTVWDIVITDDDNPQN
jgi:hypothetical protein